MSLEGRVAIVTGASRGVGRACALALARQGVRVAVAAKSTRERERLPGTIHSVAAEIGGQGGEALAIPCDVRDRGQIHRMVAETVERFGRLDILVCNAGALWWKPLTETPPRRFDLVMQVNLEATFFACQEAIPHMRAKRWGHIVTMSPPIEPERLPGHIAYFVSKFGMTMISRGLADELRGDGIAANALWPATLIESQATRNHGIGGPSDWRSPDILADALVEILRTEPPSLSGEALIDEPFLRSRGVTDFSRYAVVPGAAPRPLDSFWTPGEGGGRSG